MCVTPKAACVEPIQPLRDLTFHMRHCWCKSIVHSVNTIIVNPTVCSMTSICVIIISYMIGLSYIVAHKQATVDYSLQRV